MNDKCCESFGLFNRHSCYCSVGQMLDYMEHTTAVATFHLQDGSELVFTGVRVDSIGPSADNPGVVGVEFEEDADKVVHIPFVRYWEISYI